MNRILVFADFHGCYHIVLLMVVLVSEVWSWTERVNNFQESTCAQITNRIRLDKVVGSSAKLANVTGQWVSEKCEIRPGPEFLLRKYIIYPSGRFQLFQFYYSDANCHEPAFCIEARGKFTKGSYRRSWTVPGGTEAEIEIANVAIISYTTEIARALQRTVNGTCTTAGSGVRQGSTRHRHRHRHQHRPHRVERARSTAFWQPWERYDLFSVDFEDDLPKLQIKKKVMTTTSDKDEVNDDSWVENTIDAHQSSRTAHDASVGGNGFRSAASRMTVNSRPSPVEKTGDARSAITYTDDGGSAAEAECPSTLELSFNELQLMRIETRVMARAAAAVAAGVDIGNSVSGTVRRLYLGDVHTNSWQRAAYRPRAYQDPLVAEDTREAVTKCRVCRIVSEASDYYPPSLPLLSSTSSVPPVAQLVTGTTWTSDHCETRPYGIFLIRRLTFGGSSDAGHGADMRQSDGGFHASHHVVTRDTWEERVQYFTDPGCRNPYFTVNGRGRYTIGNAVLDFGRDVAFEADFEVAQLKVTINDKRLLPVVRTCGVRTKSKKESASDRGEDEAAAEAIRSDESRTIASSSTLGADKWLIGVERDVTSYGGCPALDVRMPKSPIPQLIAVLRRGGPHDLVLLIGQQPMDPVDHIYNSDGDFARAPLHRPTSFYPGLRRCIDGPRPTAAKSISGGKAESARTAVVGSRRPWRHVAPPASSSASTPNVANISIQRRISDVMCYLFATFGLVLMASASFVYHFE